MPSELASHDIAAFPKVHAKLQKHSELLFLVRPLFKTLVGAVEIEVKGHLVSALAQLS